MSIEIADIVARLDWERQYVPLGGENLERVEPVVRMWAPDGSHHVIIWSELSPANVDEIIAREIAHHEALGVSFEWKVYGHDRPADLKERLVAWGFEVGAVESVLVMGVDGMPVGESHGREIRVETVRTAEQVEVFKRLAEEIFDGDWSFTAGQLQSQIERGLSGHRGYIGYLDDEPGAVGRLYVHPDSQFAGLYGGGTVERLRGRGLYRATVRARMLDAAEFGAKYLMVDARETSRPILEAMGFVSVGRTWPCVRE